MPTNTPRPSDPIRLLTLLWDTTDRRGRRGVDVRSITRTAITLADAEGLGAVTMRRVSDEIGVGAMSLYTHVPGKTELVELMLDAVAAEIYDDGDTPGQQASWQDGVRHLAERNWHHHLAHPWTAEVVPGRPVLGPGISAKYEAELAPLDGIGLTDIEMDQVLCSVLALVEASARAQIGLDRVRAGSDDHDWWDTVGPALAQAMNGRRFPLAERVGTAAGQAHGAGDPHTSMRLGLTLLIDGLERRLPARNDRRHDA